MLLSLLTVAAMLIGGWTFSATISAWSRDLRKSAKPSVFPKRQVSLWSLILFIFFPSFNTLLLPSGSLPSEKLD